MERVKSLLAVVIGQSNERGKAQIESVPEQDGAPFVSNLGCPIGDPIPSKAKNAKPTNGYYGSMWPLVGQYLATSNQYWMHFRNECVGNTSWSKDWLGDSVGDGTGTPLEEGDGGFDPLGYMSDSLAGIDEGNFDERWVFLANGQADSVIPTTHANYVQSLKNVTNYYLSRGYKVAIGFSIYNNQWTIDVGDLAWQEAVNFYASNPNVIAGANLYRTLGVGVPMFDSHLALSAYPDASQDWVDALIAGDV